MYGISKQGYLSEELRVDPDGSVALVSHGSLLYKSYEKRVENLGEKDTRGVVTIMFDDGWLDTFTNAYPILKEHDFPATVAIISEYVGKRGALSKRQIQRLKHEGWDFVAHSTSDIPLTQLSSHTQEKSISDSQSYIHKNIWKTDVFAYPQGEYTDEIDGLTKHYFPSTRRYEYGVNPIPISLNDIRIYSLGRESTLEKIEQLVKKAYKNDSWLVLVGHHVDESGSIFSITPDFLSKLADLLTTHDLEVATYEEALQKYSYLESMQI